MPEEDVRARRSGGLVRHAASRLLLTCAVAFGVLAATAPVAADEAVAPIPVELPEDDGPHDVLTEWWYVTGHLETADGDLYGFEQVLFKARRGALRGIAMHVAVTDNREDRFVYDQRIRFDDGSLIGPGPGFEAARADWSMSLRDGSAELRGGAGDYAFELALTAAKPAALHGGDGFVAGDGEARSYYVSYTRLDVTGVLTLPGGPVAVTGQAWLDHQWGDFTRLSGGGWDWYAVQLDDGTELMIYAVKGADGELSAFAGTFVDAEGEAWALTEDDLEIEPTGEWTSPESGATYPHGWKVRVEPLSLDLTLTPTLENQELDTRATTGLTYWEGQVAIAGARAGQAVAGLGYVELTGYAVARDNSVP